MGLTRYERETIFNFNEEETTAAIFTYNPAMIRQLDSLTKDRPDEAVFVSENNEGGKEFEIPKKWVKIRPTRILSDEEKAKRSEIGKRAASNLRNFKK